MSDNIDPGVEILLQGAAKILMEGLGEDADIVVITVVKDGKVGSVACVDVADDEREFIAHAALQEYYIRVGKKVADAVG